MDEQDPKLVAGERRLGQYTVELLRQNADGEWSPAMMILDALVTNYRLMLRPHRRKLAPATLPAQYIKDVHLVLRGKYHSLELSLSTGHLLALILSTGHLDHLYDDLRAMKVPQPRFQFDDTIAQQDIERLISYFSQDV